MQNLCQTIVAIQQFRFWRRKIFFPSCTSKLDRMFWDELRYIGWASRVCFNCVLVGGILYYKIVLLVKGRVEVIVKETDRLNKSHIK